MLCAAALTPGVKYNGFICPALTKFAPLIQPILPAHPTFRQLQPQLRMLRHPLLRTPGPHVCSCHWLFHHHSGLLVVSKALSTKSKDFVFAQVNDSLSKLRYLLRISATLLDYKKNQIGRGSQKMNTQVRALLSCFHDKKIHCAEWYSNAYKALNILDPYGAWTLRLKFLDHKKDLQPPCRSEDDKSCEMMRELSWIWLVRPQSGPPKVVASANEINDSMTSHCARRPILTFVLLQPCMWSGPGQKHMQIDGARKYYCDRRNA